MKEQNYKNHVRLVPAFHFTLMPLGLITLIAAIVFLFAGIGGTTLFERLLFVSLSFIAAATMLFARTFACKAQDRAIRAEENLRHFALTGKLLDPRVTMSQVIALRFAPDEEFLTLCEKAVKENLTPDQIKRSVKNWKADHDRV